jgi:type I restriction enzyme R subunit
MVHRRQEPNLDMDRLSNIVKIFNDLFGNIPWMDKDKIEKAVTHEIPEKVALDKAYQNAMKNSDKKNARIEHGFALERVMVNFLTDYTELYRHFKDNPDFHKWLSDTIFFNTYNRPDVK